MNIRFGTFSSLLVFWTISSFLPAAAFADPGQQASSVFENAFFSHDRNYYENGSLKRQIDSLFGPGSVFGTTFPDNEIAKDGELVHSLYRDMLVQQSMNDPYIRTPDLPNPYDSSLLMSPRYNTNKLQVGTEYRFETVQPR
jgi:hypothetical protein